MIKPLLTKTKYMIGLQCPKYFWMLYHEPDKIPEADKATQHRFDEGHVVGELAKKLFPSGVDIGTDDFKANIKKAKELLGKRKTVFEAGILVGNIYSRADVLMPAGKEWDVIEVKSSTQVKEENLYDVAFQKHCYIEYGLNIRKCFLMHINNEYVRHGEVDPKKLFVIENISKEVDELLPDVPKNINTLMSIIASDKCPDAKIGKKCDSPYPCPVEECWDFLPEHNIFHLYRGGKKIDELFENGIHALHDIPDDFKLDVKQSIQKECARTGKPHVNKEGIKKFLKTLKYPLHYLDFETFSTVIPLYDGLRPYQQVPFQFSLHIVEKEGGKAEHISFLADGRKDPRKEFAAKLKETLGNEGSIIVFNHSFEVARLKELAEAFPEYSKWAKAVISRMVDLMELFRNFDYYSPKQKGSCSLKDVLPAMTGKGYDELEISDGSDASLAYLDLLTGKVNKQEAITIRKSLEEYCKLDTEGMVWVVGELYRIGGRNEIMH